MISRTEYIIVHPSPEKKYGKIMFESALGIFKHLINPYPHNKTNKIKKPALLLIARRLPTVRNMRKNYKYLKNCLSRLNH